MYLVDGNNVMGQRVGWHRDKAEARRRLVAELGELSQRSETAVTVIFDGPSARGFDDCTTVGEVEVLFADRGSNADDRIVDFAEGSDRPEAIVAVTSDQELAGRLEALGVRTMRSGRFRRLLEDK